MANEKEGAALKEKHGAELVWLTCLEAERSVQQVKELWGYSTAALYKTGIFPWMVQNKLLTITRAEKGEVFYLSSAKGYLEYSQKVGSFKDEYGKLMFADMDTWAKFLSDEDVRKRFFSVDKIKIFYANNREIAETNGAESILTFTASIMVSFLLMKKIIKKRKLSGKGLVKVFPTLAGFRFPPFKTIEYLEEVLVNPSDFAYNELIKYDYLLNTKTGKEAKKQADEMLKNMAGLFNNVRRSLR